MAKKDRFKELMSNIDWTRLVPILSPLIIFGAWLLFSKLDKRADAVSKLIAIAEPIPTIDLNVPRPVILASLYHSMEDALAMLDALAQALEDLPGIVSDKLQDLINQVKEEVEETFVEPITEKTEMAWWEKRLREFGFDPKGLA
tara:strand:+ start:49 stop:480 length:432 start_codon:yes stop_codon:yes gene_type:complete